ncbi:MAG: hypothetical protein AVDCRST_MAG23-2652, partial [uncultured Sphingosinicella sp.]
AASSCTCGRVPPHGLLRHPKPDPSRLDRPRRQRKHSPLHGQPRSPPLHAPRRRSRARGALRPSRRPLSRRAGLRLGRPQPRLLPHRHGRHRPRRLPPGRVRLGLPAGGL